MARYFTNKEEAVREIRDGLSRFGKPAFFGRVRNNNFGTEQWVVDYDRRDYGSIFTILEDATRDPLDGSTTPSHPVLTSPPSSSGGAGMSGFFRRLFGRGVTVPPPAPNEGSNWYFMGDTNLGLRQVVLLADPGQKTSTRFQTFFLASNYSDLMAHAIVTGLFRLDGEPCPFLMIRTDGTRNDGYEAVDEMVKHPFRVAITFQHLPTSGILSLFVGSRFLREYSKRGYLEMHYGLDLPETRSLIADAFQGDALQAVHTRGLGPGPTAKWDLSIPLDGVCRQILAREWEALLAHHSRIARPDFQAATQRIFQLFPPGADPILPAPGGQPTP